MRRTTADPGDFPTRDYDLVKELVLALAFVLAASLVLAAVFSSPDERPITLQRWAQVAPDDVVATAAAELAGTSASATYGPPYNHADVGQKLLGVPLQKWGGVRLPVDSADLVLGPMRSVSGDPSLTAARATWDGASTAERTRWATAYGDALAKAPSGSAAAVSPGSYGPVPALTAGFLTLARAGGLEGALTSSGTFYGGDQTRSLLLLSDGAAHPGAGTGAVHPRTARPASVGAGAPPGLARLLPAVRRGSGISVIRARKQPCVTSSPETEHQLPQADQDERQGPPGRTRRGGHAAEGDEDERTEQEQRAQRIPPPFVGWHVRRRVPGRTEPALVLTPRGRMHGDPLPLRRRSPVDGIERAEHEGRRYRRRRAMRPGQGA